LFFAVPCRFEWVTTPNFGLHGMDVKENEPREVAFPYVFAYDVLFHNMEVENALDKRN